MDLRAVGTAACQHLRAALSLESVSAFDARDEYTKAIALLEMLDAHALRLDVAADCVLPAPVGGATPMGTVHGALALAAAEDSDAQSEHARLRAGDDGGGSAGAASSGGAAAAAAPPDIRGRGSGSVASPSLSSCDDGAAEGEDEHGRGPSVTAAAAPLLADPNSPDGAAVPARAAAAPAPGLLRLSAELQPEMAPLAELGGADASPEAHSSVFGSVQFTPQLQTRERATSAVAGALLAAHSRVGYIGQCIMSAPDDDPYSDVGLGYADDELARPLGARDMVPRDVAYRDPGSGGDELGRPLAGGRSADMQSRALAGQFEPASDMDSGFGRGYSGPGDGRGSYDSLQDLRRRTAGTAAEDAEDFAASPLPSAPVVAIGNEDAKTALRHCCLLRGRVPASMMRGCRRYASTVLLHGPPGTGKTTIATWAAQQFGYELHIVSPSSIVSKWAGESERALRDVFATARSAGRGELNHPRSGGAPMSTARPRRSIIFFDEIDALCSARGAGDDASSRRLLCELLLQLNELQRAPVANDLTGASNVLVFAATNRIGDLDEAVLRRFDHRIHVGLPDDAAREELVRVSLDGIDHGLRDADVVRIAELTAGWSHSDVTNLCSHAAMRPVHEATASLLEEAGAMTDALAIDADDVRTVVLDDFTHALKFVSRAASHVDPARSGAAASTSNQGAS